jgi:endonuclease YncB( thermonuclease family)
MLTEVIAAGLMFTCTPTHVYDGDGPVWCAEGPRLRLAGIAAREMDETCRPNQPCPPASAIQSRDYLVSLLGKPVGRSSHGHIVIRAHEPLRCRSMGNGVGNRTAAWCSNSRGSINHMMVRTSFYALKWDRYWR